ncbi:hypothetical protein BH09BAC3_BH09BAC3_35250 [soil metagenome]
MTKRRLFFFALYFSCLPASAQWSTSGNNLYSTNSGSVGIGATNPSAKLEVAGTIGMYGTGLDGSMLQKFVIYADASNGLLFDTPLNSSNARYNIQFNWRGVLTPPPFFIQGSTSNVGIGTATPTSKFEIAGAGGLNVDMKLNGRMQLGDASNNAGIFVNTAQTMYMGQLNSTHMGFYNGAWRFIVDNSGNVGIGTTTPLAKVQLNINGSSTNPEALTWPDISMFLQNSNATNGNLNVVGFGDASGLGVAAFGTITDQTNHTAKLFFSTKPSISDRPLVRMLIDENGNVGIGTKTPDQKLTVNGKIHATEVIVTSTVPTPDYVFESSYILPDLKDVKSYIDQNKHLPDVPSAVDIEKNGINLSEMNMLLLKKVEELTLYVIELKKENEKQQKQIDGIIIK